MATVVVLADPPRNGLVLDRLVETSPLSPDEAVDLYVALLRDAVVAAEESGGEPLVNYRPDELLPEKHRREVETEAAVRVALDGALAEPGEVRFEKQVGSTRAARIGNTVTHLLDEEEKNAVVVDPAAPLAGRTAIDQAAMKLRSSDVALAPGTAGRVALMAFGAAPDFEAALAPPAVETLTTHAVEADLDVDFLAVQPVVETESDLAELISLLRARAEAGRIVPEFTAEAIAELGLTVATEDGELTVRRQ